jgi:hypothetical protein
LGLGPFHAALREAIQKRGLTLDRLRFHLSRRGISVALSTLSDWQQGNRRPDRAHSLRTVRALEDVLDLASGELVRLLVCGAGHPDAGPGAPRPRVGLDERAGALGELLASLPGGYDRGVRTLSRQETHWVDERRVSWRSRDRMVVRAVRDGVDRFAVRYFGDEGALIDRVSVVARENCRVGRVLRHPGTPVLVAELLFGEALAAGDTWVFEYELIDPTGQPCREHASAFAEPSDHFVLEVRFDPRALPVDCHGYIQPGLYEERRRTADLVLNSHHAVHLVASDVSTGVIGITWDWP